MTQLSPAQHGIWLTERTLDTGGAYHLAVTLDLAGPLDGEALDRACRTVTAHHPALTSRPGPDGSVHPCEVPAPRRADCAPEELDAVLARERAAPFDAEDGPLCRFTLFRTAPERHVLLVTAHHLVLDGESKDRLVADLAAAYRSDPLPPTAGAPAGAPAPEALAAARVYWEERGYAPGTPVLPGLVPPADGGLVAAPGAEVPFRLDAGRCAALAEAARKLGVTRFELLLSAWHALLVRYGDPAPATAVELSLRMPGAPVGIGLAVNELPLRVATVEGRDPLRLPFEDWVRSVRAELRALYPHRSVPLGQTVRGLAPRTALTPLSVSYRRRPAAPAPDFGAVTAGVRWIGFPGAVRNLLHLQLVDGGDEIHGSAQYRTAPPFGHAPGEGGTDPDRTAAAGPGAGRAGCLTADVVRRIVGHWTRLLDGALADLTTPLGDLPLLDEDELRDQLAAAAPRPDLAARTVPALLAAQAEKRPDEVAVVADGEHVTYAELARRVAHAAAALARHGAGPGTLVGIGLPRGLDQLVAVLGTLAAGAAHLPLDPAYPAERLAFVRADAALSLRVTHAPEDAGDLTPADLAPPAGAAVPSLPLPDPSLPAYVLYTSGSTGLPKGVEVPHSALANVLGSLAERLGSRPEDRWLGLTSLSFDISAVELLLPLTTGGRVVLVPENAHRDGPALLDLIRREGVTHVQATPSGWRLLLDAGLDGTLPVRTALTGGEALPAPLAARLTAAAERLVNVYGPTETTIWSTLAEPALTPEGSVSLGSPLANTRVQVLDSGARPVPYGVVGELYLGGAGVAHGYRGRPGLTATRFLPDPYGPPGSRMYRTGDLVRRGAGGALEFLGRSDSQVKLRGHRIELGEIEARLARHPAVAQAAAVLHGPETDRRLTAYVVPSGAVPHADALRAFLAGSLPAAVLPAAYVVLDAFPLTPNGKLDRAALPEPETVRPEPVAAPPADEALDPIGAAVLAIWREVLELDDLTPDEDLFDLGGHSLIITAIAARIHERLGAVVPLDVFFDTPTARDVADVVRALREEALDPIGAAVLAIWREVLELDDLTPDEDLFDL
ncbi:amino acid adenylation domain-containing protein, partial [Streptomyces sp. NPDC058052]|uniref:non-ribosomal peptide synthetase n=1 Tax=Streptomyces sp. NPDC058052 TaxID=3346316 RepID=UPI0036E9DDF6